MKTLIIILALLLCPVLSCAGGTFTWSEVTQNTDGTPVSLSGYNIYETTSVRAKINMTVIPTSACVTGLCSWPYAPVIAEGATFVCTAIGINGKESGDSNTATYGKMPANPGSFQVR